jgi:quinol monooxygenase YgiN
MRLGVAEVGPESREKFMKAISEDALGANTLEPNNVNYIVGFGTAPNDDIVMILQVYRDKSGYYDHIATSHSENFMAALGGTDAMVLKPIIDMTGRAADGGDAEVLELDSFMPRDENWRDLGIRNF